VILSASKEAEDPSANISQHTAGGFSCNTSNFSSCTVFHFSQRMRTVHTNTTFQCTPQTIEWVQIWRSTTKKSTVRQIPLRGQPLKSLLCGQWHPPANGNSTPILLLLIRGRMVSELAERTGSNYGFLEKHGQYAFRRTESI
jgi:hypothetical protein